MAKEVMIDIDEDDLHPSPTVEDSEEEEFVVYKPGEEIPPEEPEVDPRDKELEELRSQMVSKGNNDSAVVSGFQELSKTLAEMNKPKAEPTPAYVPPDIDKINEDMKSKIYDNPLEATGIALNTFINPQLQGLQAKIAESEFKAERLETMMTNPDLFKKYGSEIDEMAKSLGKGPGSYQKALTMVKGNHIEDFIQMKVQEELAKVTGKPTPQPQFTGVTGTPPPGTRTKKQIAIPMTEEDERQARASVFDRDEWIRREYKKGRWSK